MSNTIVIADTGALISLEKIPNGFDFIAKLYDTIFIPKKVLQEYEVKGRLDVFITSGLIQVLEEPPLIAIASPERLHDGELHALQHCLQFKRQGEQDILLLIEEEAGRNCAFALGIPYSGIAGQIQKAYFRSKITKPRALAYLREMRDTNRINKRIYKALLENISQND